MDNFSRAAVAGSLAGSLSSFTALDMEGFWGYENIVSIAFDPDKEARNLNKHGVSLVRAEEMDMATAVVREDDRFRL
ncbi:MAG TPA: hypothetical protein VE865_16080 [Bradyrhizobium sp.]|nr:hypothetical protein [Bradyrhizobium sp.]